MVADETQLHFSRSGLAPLGHTAKMRYKLTTFHQYFIDLPTVGLGSISSSWQNSQTLWIPLFFPKIFHHKRRRVFKRRFFLHWVQSDVKFVES